jgi:hypothetical protein
VIAEHLWSFLTASIVVAAAAQIASWRYVPWTFHPNEDWPRARLPDKLDPVRLLRFGFFRGVTWAAIGFAAGIYLK